MNDALPIPDLSQEQLRLAEPMRSRWSASIFDADHVLDAADVELLLEAARWAPTCGNGQPARFVVAPRGTASHRVVVEHLSRGNAGWVPRASLVVVAGTAFGPDEAGEGGRMPAYADFDLGQAVAHLTLQATAMGLATHQFAGFDRAGVAADLGVPPYVRLLVGIALGVRADPASIPGLSERDAEREAKPRRRTDLDTHVVGTTWGAPWREAWSGEASSD